MRDITHTIRAFLKAPVFATGVIAILAIGIGMTTVLFSVLHGVLVRPLPFPESARLVMLWEKNANLGIGPLPVSEANFFDWRRESRALERLAPFTTGELPLQQGGELEQVPVAMVSAEVLTLLGVRPLLGHTFVPEDNRPGQTNVALLAERTWRKRFQADPAIVGKKVALRDRTYTIIGILQEPFQFPSPLLGRRPEFWLPLTLDPAGAPRKGHGFDVLARVQPGISALEAQTELSGIAERLARAFPSTNAGWGAVIVPLRRQMTGGVERPLWLLFVSAALLLLLACANIANLHFTRATARLPEIAICRSLGATDWRIIRRLLSESIMLAVAGGAIGLLLAQIGLKVLQSLAFERIPRIDEASLDWTVMAFASAVSLLAGAVSGAAPALYCVRGDLTRFLRSGAQPDPRSRRGTRLRQALMASQVSLAVVLLTSAGLLVRSFLKLTTTPLGYDPTRVTCMEIRMPARRYSEPARRVALAQQLLDKLAPLPGLAASSITDEMPLDNRPPLEFGSDGVLRSDRNRPPLANVAVVTPAFFQSLSIPLRNGRALASSDTSGAPRVVVINDTLARRYWPGENPLGHRITVQYNGDQPFQIVGVVGDVRYGYDRDPRPDVYIPFAQAPVTRVFLIVRSAAPGPQSGSAARAAVRATDASLLVTTPSTMDRLLEESVAQPRVRTLMTLAFGVIAMILTAAGLHGMLAYWVALRIRELGLRMALGATMGTVIRMVLRHNLQAVLAGLVLGLLAAAALARTLASFLFGVSPTDFATYVAVTVLVGILAMLSSVAACIRATRVDPLLALKS